VLVLVDQQFSLKPFGACPKGCVSGVFVLAEYGAFLFTEIGVFVITDYIED
jgi:hypothetical protein